MRSSSAAGRPAHPISRLTTGQKVLAGLVAGTLISAVCLWILVATFDTGQAFALVGRANPELVLLALLPLAISMLVRTIRWRVLLDASLHGNDAGAGRLLPFVLVGYAANVVLPMRLGDAARAVTASRRLRIGFPETIGSVGLERVLDAGGLAIIALAASVGTPVPGWLIGTSALLVGATLIFLVVVYGVWRLGSRIAWARGTVVARLGRGLRSDPRAVVIGFVLSCTIWCIDAVTFWTIARALGVDLAWSGAILIATGAALGGILPSAPAAIGTFELAGTAIGTAIGLDGASALAIVVVGHLATVLPLLLAGAVSIPLIGLRGTDLGAEQSASTAA